MIYIAWIISLVVTFYLGYKFGELEKKVKKIQETVKQKIDKPKQEEPQSEIIDPLDEVQTAMYEHKQLMKRLNPDE